MANLNYSPKDILQQEFKTKMRGYDPVEVDEFLDNVIKDYEAYNKEILALQEENDRLQAKLSQQATNPAPTPSRVQTEVPKSQTVTNFDILKRLSNLEKEVFGKKLDQDAADHSEVTTRVSQALNSNYTNDENSDDNERTRRF